MKTPFNIDISMPIPSQPVSWWEERKKKHQQGDISWSNTKFFKLDNEKYRYVEEHTGKWCLDLGSEGDNCFWNKTEGNLSILFLVFSFTSGAVWSRCKKLQEQFYWLFWPNLSCCFSGRRYLIHLMLLHCVLKHLCPSQSRWTQIVGFVEHLPSIGVV